MTAKTGTRGLRAALLNASSCLAAAVLAAGTANAIVINDNHTPTDAIDNAGGVNGVGQMIIDNGGGSVGLCTGTLINPRTVIFAAHCVNTRPASAYGVGGRDMAFFFNVNNRNVDGVDALIRWLFVDKTTDAALNYFNVNQVSYHPDVMLVGSGGTFFLQADIALASLDAPAAAIPTWAMLFSPLPVPDAIDPVTGTGYHVNITGYGANGVGTTGATGSIDFRRRAAENMLGALASLDDRNWFLFGTDAGLPQNLYHIDFDDPANANIFDFNVHRDEALPREGGTAGGDSGGPLILDAANNSLTARDLVLGVLSGGSRFFGPQPGSSYGTTSFYQPLYLFWDYIAANNPYRYVAAVAGNGAWEDAAHWRVSLDPNYFIIDEAGAVVNGVPGNPGAGIDGDEPKFGQICFDYGPGIVCVDTATGAETDEPNDGIGLASFIGSADLSDQRSELADQAARVPIAEDAPHAVYSSDPLPAPTLANGLPGATSFVPNNVEPTAGGTRARYYDVTLGAAGTTTLSSAVTIDRLTVMSSAGLTVAASGALTSLIDVTQTGGTVSVNGRLTSTGDYSLLGGYLTGSGRVVAPYLTSVMGAIAPGATGNGTVGTLTVDGSVILASGSGFLVDIASSASADRLTVNGALNVGGTFVASALAGYLPTYNQSWTVASASGGVTGSFSTVMSNFGGILRAQVTTTANSVLLRILAGDFADAASYTSDEQVEVATTLDLIRDMPGGYAALSGLFASLDLTDPAALPTVMEALTPLNGLAAHGLAQTSVGLFTRAIVDRAGQLSDGTGHGFDASGVAALFGDARLQAAADPFDAMMMGTLAVAAAQEAAAETVGRASSLKLREGWGGFLDVSTAIDNAYETTPFAGDADLTATAGTLGFDYGFSDGAFAGFAVSYASADADLDAPRQSAEADSWGLTVYGGVHEGASFLNGYVGYSSQSYDLERIVPLLLGSQTLAATPDGQTWSAGAKMGIDLGGDTNVFTPYAAIDAKWISIDAYSETGGSAALSFDQQDVTLIDARLGLKYAGTFDMGEGAILRPRLGVAWVIDVQSDDNVLNTAFAAFPAAPLTFVGSDRKGDWVEYEVALEYVGGNFGLAVTYTGGDNGVLTYNTLSGRVSFSW